MNSVPVYEMKNKLSQYLHMVVEEGPVGISVHGKPSFVIQTIEEFDEKRVPKQSFYSKSQEIKMLYTLNEDDDFDYTAYFDSIRDRNYFDRPDADHIFDGV